MRGKYINNASGSPKLLKFIPNRPALKAEIIRTDLTKEIYLCYIQLQL